MALKTDTEGTKQAIDELLQELPPESLEKARRFIERLRQQAEQNRPMTETANDAPYLYPTVVTPVSNLQALSELLEHGYAGDALADTEALYDGN